MHDPLKVMILRRAELDAYVELPGITSRLNTVASPLGGTFGMVRSGGHKRHGGWDLYAAVGTPCFAVCGCQFEFEGVISGYGLCLVLKLLDPEAISLARRHGAENLYALYAHLASVTAGRASYMAGAPVALAGNSGNASNTPPHLHLEIRTTPLPKRGDGAAIDPAELLGSAPLVSRSDDVVRLKRIYGLR
ncbi:MAG: M23 family metallopeptidase [Planctomycetota bacterium]|nr:M23 family metallopeptidase [Planctomycetota bacterium]